MSVKCQHLLRACAVLEVNISLLHTKGSIVIDPQRERGAQRPVFAIGGDGKGYLFIHRHGGIERKNITVPSPFYILVTAGHSFFVCISQQTANYSRSDISFDHPFRQGLRNSKRRGITIKTIIRNLPLQFIDQLRARWHRRYRILQLLRLKFYIFCCHQRCPSDQKLRVVLATKP